MQQQPITSFSGQHRWLSNFHPSPVTYERETYPTVEHAYQAAKTANTWDRSVIRSQPTAGHAKRMGRGLRNLIPNWDKVKLDVMAELIRHKFNDPALRKLLLATGDAELVEGNYWGDTFWGVCKGIGENNLGLILMRRRLLIRKSL